MQIVVGWRRVAHWRKGRWMDGWVAKKKPTALGDQMGGRVVGSLMDGRACRQSDGQKAGWRAGGL
eukprot:15415893-Alexandrium_andersonii.AAC.1